MGSVDREASYTLTPGEIARLAALNAVENYLAKVTSAEDPRLLAADDITKSLAASIAVEPTYNAPPISSLTARLRTLRVNQQIKQRTKSLPGYREAFTEFNAEYATPLLNRCLEIMFYPKTADAQIDAISDATEQLARITGDVRTRIGASQGKSRQV